MPESAQAQRLNSLLAAQNEDGGWGYFAGKRSWLEPTVYSLLALHSQHESPQWRKGWNLLRSWQFDDGAWRPNAQVAEPHWSTALAITLHCVMQTFDEPFHKGVRWLLSQKGQESSGLARFLGLFFPNHLGHDRKYAGWPWLPGTSSWIEPTTHALIALKKSAPQVNSEELRRRIVLGEGMILRRRCVDGGWNYGNRSALGVDLPSYPETTALALLGLQQCSEADLTQDVACARELYENSESRLSRAWLALSLRNLGVALPDTNQAAPTRDVVLTAIEALSSPGGGHALLRPAQPV